MCSPVIILRRRCFRQHESCILGFDLGALAASEAARSSNPRTFKDAPLPAYMLWEHSLALQTQLLFPPSGLFPSNLHLMPHFEETLLCVPPLLFGFCFLFLRLPTISLSSPPTSLSLSLSPPSLCCISTRAAQYSRGFPWQRSPDMQQVSVSRGTRFASSPLAHPAGFAGAPDWLARSSGLMVFTEMRS